jgi:endoglucanase
MVLAGGAVRAECSDIRLNTLGFLPDMPKKATVTTQGETFSVRNAKDDAVVYSGLMSGPFKQQDIGQEVWIADFSEVKIPGRYVLDVPGIGRSIEFPIGPKAYDGAFYTVMRGFYLWRCGAAVEGVHNGNRYAHGPCHLEDGWQDYIGLPGTRRDGTGGWHDAGDYGKYTVNAGVTVGVLFLAWDHFRDQLKTFSLDLPETAPGGWPDYLKELKWEIDWLLKMQFPDGSGKVSHKLTRKNFSGFIMPEEDKEKRFFTDWSSAATADFVAMTAMAARYFRPYDADYADYCLAAAKTSYAFLQANPEDKRPDLRDFSTGGYGTSDPDDRLWAAAEMWETTGDVKALSDFENRAKAQRRLIEANWDWGNVGNLGMLTYLFSQRSGRDSEVVERIRISLIETADEIVRQSRNDVYARPLGGRYYWGSNGTVARQTVLLQAANRLSPKPEYVHTTLGAIDHLFGRNYYGRSYVTGLGYRPPMHPHDRRSGADEVDAPWPGYLVGGGQRATDWKDEQEDYRTNEIAINWQAAMVYALAGFVHADAK